MVALVGLDGEVVEVGADPLAGPTLLYAQPHDDALAWAQPVDRGGELPTGDRARRPVGAGEDEHGIRPGTRHRTQELADDLARVVAVPRRAASLGHGWEALWQRVGVRREPLPEIAWHIPLYIGLRGSSPSVRQRRVVWPGLGPPCCLCRTLS